MSVPAQYQTAEGLRTLANYLRSSNGVKVRSGIEHEKRVEYFKGMWMSWGYLSYDIQVILLIDSI